MASKLVFVQFVKPVSVGGQFSSLEYWSLDKHGKAIECTERGDWVYLAYGDGERRRIPMANVAFLSDKVTADKVSK